MHPRLTGAEFEKRKGEPNRRAMKRIIDSGEVPGLLGYDNGVPVVWCSVAPRERFSRIMRSPFLKLLDDRPVWSVVCLFVAPSHRKQGVTAQTLEAVTEYVRGQGGKIVEGYPIVPKKSGYPDVFLYHGTATAFRKAGFTEVARPSDTRRVMRYFLD